MAYTQATLVCNGALEEEQNFPDTRKGTQQFNEWLARVKQEALEDCADAQVYVLYHPHQEEQEECTCIQFARDMLPLWDCVEGP